MWLIECNRLKVNMRYSKRVSVTYALKQPYVMHETSSRVGPFLETTQSLPGTIFSSTSYFSLLQGLDELLGLDHNKI